MAALAKTEDAKLETERRRAQAAIAGKVAAASPRHVSKQRNSAERAPRRRTDCCGKRCGGSIKIITIERDSAFFAFDADGVLIGAYATRTQAVRSIPVVR